MSSALPAVAPPSGKPVNWRGLVWQIVLIAAVVWLGYEAFTNARANMQARNIPSDFSFWFRTSGFDINQTLISYSAVSTYGRAFMVGLINTLAVAAAGVFLATAIGFSVGIARLSSNWIVAKLASAYVELLRNTPLLLQLLFWYNAVLKQLPHPRQSMALPAIVLQVPGVGTLLAGIGALLVGFFLIRWSRGHAGEGAGALLARTAGSFLLGFGVLALLFGGLLAGLPSGTGDSFAGLIGFSKGQYGFLNNRGLYLPYPEFTDAMGNVWLVLIASSAAALFFYIWAGKRQLRTGVQLPRATIALGLVFLPAALTFWLAGNPVGFDLPKPRGFNLAGGWRVYPEFFALLLGLSLYTAAFIAEIVRAGILAVPKGQTEAAGALGLRRQSILKLVVVPQAMRVIVPPLTNQYLNLTKNSSLAVFIGYPDLVQVFAGTVLNQTGAAVQVIAITMAVYLVISLVTSAVMNIYNRRVALVER
jgi:general L-amino acid transport system permease protein